MEEKAPFLPQDDHWLGFQKQEFENAVIEGTPTTDEWYYTCSNGSFLCIAVGQARTVWECISSYFRISTSLDWIFSTHLELEQVLSALNQYIGTLGLEISGWFGVLDRETGMLHFCNFGDYGLYNQAGECLSEIQKHRFPDTETLFFDKQILQLQSNDPVYVRACSQQLEGLKISWSGVKFELSDHMSVYFYNQLSEIEKLHHVVEAFAAHHQISSEKSMHMNLVLEEMLNNVISYAYRDHERHRIDLEFSLKNGVWTAVLIDDGIAFDPLQKPEVDIELSLDERDIGGLGIHFARTLLSHVEYKRVDHKNRLTMQLHV